MCARHDWDWFCLLAIGCDCGAEFTNQSHSLVKQFTSQCGQTKPLIFSTIPSTFTSILRQKLSSLLMVASATSWGVVTTTAPSGLTFFNALTTVRCSSDVPGGVSAGEAITTMIRMVYYSVITRQTR